MRRSGRLAHKCEEKKGLRDAGEAPRAMGGSVECYSVARVAALEVILELEESLADGKESAGDRNRNTRRLSVLRDEEKYKAGQGCRGLVESRQVEDGGRGDQMKEGRPNPNLSGMRANKTRNDSDADRGRETEDGGALENEGEDADENDRDLKGVGKMIQYGWERHEAPCPYQQEERNAHSAPQPTGTPHAHPHNQGKRVWTACALPNVDIALRIRASLEELPRRAGGN
ncbi:hypothetical protein B0H13DRAFT_1935348 [Mycena leptocephala]|nr:hypothetical protein B0H13DRAFT_1935348 [Mycena leptocephala]